MLAFCSILAILMKFLFARYPYRIVEEESPEEAGQITPPYEVEKDKDTTSHV
jgi:hypothetical protein